MTFVLLVDKKTPAKNYIQPWLDGSGLVSWLANDVSHAIEELSDFTVRNRPDVIMLEVALLSESFDSLRSTLNMSAGEGSLTVLGIDGGSKQHDKSFVNSFAELRSVIRQRQCA